MSTLHIAALISLACLGVRAVTDKGMIFYFLRCPFERLEEKRDEIDETILEKIGDLQYLTYTYRLDSFKTLFYTSILYLMKPILTCSTCMASVHTLIWFPVLTGELFTYKLILVMLIVAFFNTVGWLLVNVMRKFIS